MPSLSSLGTLFFRGGLVEQGGHRLLRRHVPELHAQPDLRRRLQVGRRRGRALVVPRVRAAARGRGPRAARGRRPDRSSGSSMEENDAYATGRDAVRRGRAARAARTRRRPAARAGRRSRGQRRGAPAAARRRVGRARRRSGARSSPSSRSSTTCARGPTSSASPRTGCSRCAKRELGAHPGGLFAGDLPVDGYGEDYDFWVDARAATPRRRLRRLDPALGARRRRPGRLPRPARRRAAVARCGPRPSPTRGSDDEAAYPPDLDAPPNRWELAATWGARHLADRVARARRATRCSPAPAWRTWPRGSAVAKAREQGSDVQLTAEIGLWGYDPAIADPFVLNHRNFPRSTMLDDASMVLGTLVGGAGHDDARVPRRRAGRPASATSTRRSSPTARSSSAPGAATTSRRCAPRRSSSRCSRRSARRRSAATSRRRVAPCARSSPTSARSRSRRPTTSSCSSRSRRDPSRSTIGSRRRGPRAGGTSGSPTRSPSSRRPTPQEIAPLRRWDPRGWFLRAR